MSVRVVVHLDLCKGSACHLCITYCPKKILIPSDVPSKMEGTIPVVTDNALCIDCGMCEYHCPELAISVDKVMQTETS